MRTVEERPVQDSSDRFTALYAAHALTAFRFAYMLTGVREVAEDVTHDAFLRAFGRVEDLRDAGAFGAYLRTTILNQARGLFRRRRAEDRSLLRYATMATLRSPAIAEIGERDHLWHALQRLPYRQRAALVLRYYVDLSELETARALGTTPSAVKALVTRGGRTMRRELGRSQGVDES